MAETLSSDARVWQWRWSKCGPFTATWGVAAAGGLSGLSVAWAMGIKPGRSRGARERQVVEGSSFHIALCELQAFCSNDYGDWGEGDKG